MAQPTVVSSSRTYRVAEVAAIAGVTVRTLHHYDAIDLLTPSGRSRAGYRLYTDRDLLRLQQILIQRELGLPLEQIRRVLDDPAFDLHAALLAQKAALEARAAHTRAMLDAVDVALSRVAAPDYQQEERTISMQDLFQGFEPEQYEEEARQRWGQTDAYRESARRTKSYTPADWARFSQEQTQVYAGLLSLMQAGVKPQDASVQELVERHRLLIDQWFYPCSPEMHANLASLYEGDSRFEQNIDKFGAGLTRFLVAAIRHKTAG
jgi:MerR family transcriptional regulator, thiopeptide resistance regulator